MDTFIALADMIEDAFPDLAVDGEEDNDTDRGSVAVVKEDGEQIQVLLQEDTQQEELVRDLLLGAGYKQN